MVLNVPVIILKMVVKYMKAKTGMALVGMGVVGTLLYQQMKNGNFKHMVSKMNKAKIKAIDDLEEMM